MDVRLHLGRNVREGGPVYLAPFDLVTHVHCKGSTGVGKSRLIFYIVQQLIKLGKQFCLIDPHGTLYRVLLDWLVVMGYTRPITLLNPSYIKRIVGFNPFTSEYADESRLMTKAERLVTSTLRIWKAENPNSYSNIERWLRCIYYTILEQQLSVGEIRYFLYWHQKEERQKLIDALKSQSIRDQLKDFYSVPDWKFKQDIESTRNKLQKFIHPQMRRIMGLRENNIDLRQIVDGKKMLLCNFQAAEDELIGLENTRVLGTLLLSELWESFRKRKEPTEFYLLIDECHLYLGPDIQQILTEARKYGLHLLLFHQHDGQIKEIAGAMQQAQTKITFSTEDEPKEQRHFTLRRANHKTCEVEVPLIKDWHVSNDQRDRYVEQLTQGFMTCQEVDTLLATPQNEEVPQDRVIWKAKPKT
jgi:uncharacterized protein DUF87